jgi:DNA-binding NarL/FixJ family response regulator
MIKTLSGRSVMVVDDHSMVIAGMHALLTRQSWVGRFLSAQNHEDAVDLVRRYDVNVAIVDLFIGEQRGLDLARALKAEQPALKIILMSGTGSVAPAVARAAGVDGFVPKYWNSPDVVEAVYRVSRGATILPRSTESEPTRKLSQREHDVLKHIVEGLSNPETALLLHLSRHTVKQHTTAIYRKLGARNRAEAASMARQLGLV